MPVPWIQIVRLMPSILEVSRELLKRSRRAAPGEPASGAGQLGAAATLESRVVALEENERRQAELLTSMADQLAQLTSATTALHTQVRWLIVGQVGTAVIALIAIVFAVH
jgi:uncharacterized coiled-coil protein SlyX